MNWSSTLSSIDFSPLELVFELPGILTHASICFELEAGKRLYLACSNVEVRKICHKAFFNRQASLLNL